MLPRIALTMGDVAGIGPEVIVRAWSEGALSEWCRPVVVGDPEVLSRAVRLLGYSLRVIELERVEYADPKADCVPCWNPSGNHVIEVPAGSNDARAGKAAYDWLSVATYAALNGQVDAITTAPLSKAALHLAGFDYPGHTEILAEICGVRDFAMMLYLPSINANTDVAHRLGVAHVTLHTSIRSVPDLLNSEAIVEKIQLLDRFLNSLGIPQPRLAVCALNPHAGEGGLFGNEEAAVIHPAVRESQCRGLCVSGPLPADAVFQRAVSGEFDGVVAMYHDQGHIALKLIGMRRAVNVTLGLPIVRTSPSHGTAFDIAWKGLASADGMIEAIRVAKSLSRPRMKTSN
jgi:4-hydroxythreonine-4-phosphate dehydrogenase